MIMVRMGNEDSPESVYMMKGNKTVAQGRIRARPRSGDIFLKGRSCKMRVKQDLVLSVVVEHNRCSEIGYLYHV